ncbi:PEP-CTERM sorting domain-containing protein [Povalibacter sp.]|uniref:PEP-CTERM sorting domain-containing protein n=1 Tax=Povalibacter sp. TaxID=1962978 RepID=UPI002F42B33B
MNRAALITFAVLSTSPAQASLVEALLTGNYYADPPTNIPTGPIELSFQTDTELFDSAAVSFGPDPRNSQESIVSSFAFDGMQFTRLRFAVDGKVVSACDGPTTGFFHGPDQGRGGDWILATDLCGGLRFRTLNNSGPLFTEAEYLSFTDPVATLLPAMRVFSGVFFVTSQEQTLYRGKDLTWTVTPVPEPSTLGLLAFGLLGGLLVRRKT